MSIKDGTNSPQSSIILPSPVKNQPSQLSIKEEYEYTRPENMMEFLEALKDDITRQDGFEKNVTISEKPFVIPNSLIVNDVKNYFGVR